MKRKGNLIASVAALENLELAFHKAQKGMSGKKFVQVYRKSLHTNLLQLRQQILSGDVEVGNYHLFTIYDPKLRQICAAPFGQRVLHHALKNICHDFFEKKQTNDSYASRIGRGTYAALDAAKRNTQQYQWFLKLDVRKYFASTDHHVFRQQLCGMFKDATLLQIFDKIIDSYESEPAKGMPIGNLTSQYLANHYLSVADHYIKEVLGVPAYVRYMDDMVLWHNDKEALLNIGLQFEKWVLENLKLTLKPLCLNASHCGLPFLGYVLYPDKTLLGKRSRKRYISKFKRHVKCLETGDWSQKEFQRHVEPMVAFTEYADAKSFRRHVERLVPRGVAGS